MTTTEQKFQLVTRTQAGTITNISRPIQGTPAWLRKLADDDNRYYASRNRDRYTTPEVIR